MEFNIMRLTKKMLFLLISFALVTSCGGNSSSSPSLNFDSELPTTAYQSTACLEPSEYEATIGLTPEDIKVLSACIHKDSSKDKLILETKPNAWVQVLYSDEVALTTARKLFSAFRVIGMEPVDENTLFNTYSDKWENYLAIINRLPKDKDGFLTSTQLSTHEQQSMLSTIIEDEMESVDNFV
jgi:hypothetical protein